MTAQVHAQTSSWAWYYISSIEDAVETLQEKEAFCSFQTDLWMWGHWVGSFSWLDTDCYREFLEHGVFTHKKQRWNLCCIFLTLNIDTCNPWKFSSHFWPVRKNKWKKPGFLMTSSHYWINQSWYGHICRFLTWGGVKKNPHIYVTLGWNFNYLQHKALHKIYNILFFSSHCYIIILNCVLF